MAIRCIESGKDEVANFMVGEIPAPDDVHTIGCIDIEQLFIGACVHSTQLLSPNLFYFLCKVSNLIQAAFPLGCSSGILNA